ncbi:hypothetical protein [Streptosporangium sp. NPDC002524]|uniref:hypothetical protein n=1 Tax=Streptosporangium sp. NPDC002524 TaxID=3154537 RepID=UPI00331840DD
MAELTKLYGHTWTISEAAGGGWYAVRRADMSVYGLEHGLSNIRCGATLAELARRLDTETRLENRPWRRVPLTSAP